MRFADQQMKVLRHEHIAEYDKAMPSADLFQKFEQQVAAVGGSQQRTVAVTTTGDKVQIVGAIETLETARHDRQYGFVDTPQSVTVVTSPTLSHRTRKGRAPSSFRVMRKDGPPAIYF